MLYFIYLIVLITAELTHRSLRHDNEKSLLKQMQFDVRKPCGGLKISHLITSADDRWLGGAGRVEVPLKT